MEKGQRFSELSTADLAIVFSVRAHDLPVDLREEVVKRLNLLKELEPTRSVGPSEKFIGLSDENLVLAHASLLGHADHAEVKKEFRYRLGCSDLLEELLRGHEAAARARHESEMQTFGKLLHDLLRQVGRKAPCQVSAA